MSLRRKEAYNYDVLLYSDTLSDQQLAIVQYYYDFNNVRYIA